MQGSGVKHAKKKIRYMASFGSEELFYCPKCYAMYCSPKNRGKAVEALILHRRTCGETWQRAKDHDRIRYKTYFGCEWCGVRIAAWQSAKHLVQLITEHLRGHAHRLRHACGSCRSACSG